MKKTLRNILFGTALLGSVAGCSEGNYSGNRDSTLVRDLTLLPSPNQTIETIYVQPRVDPFDHLDKNKDGKISKDEWAPIYKFFGMENTGWSGLELSQEQLEQYFDYVERSIQ